MELKILIAAGGTGGHLFPAMAVVEEVLELCPDAEVVFVGREKGLERERIEGGPWRYIPIRVKGMTQRGIVANLSALWHTFRATFQCRKILKRERPDLVVGFGCFVSAPLVLAAKGLGIPTVIHEQNALPGRVNRWLAGRVDRIYVSHDTHTLARAFRRAEKVGVPIRRDVLEAPADFGRFGLQPGKPTILIFGGSQGARSLCRNGVEALQILSSRGFSFQAIIQTGEHSYEETRNACLPEGVTVRPFLEDMGAAYACADVVLARAGAGSIAEIAAHGVPSILVPYPHAADDHQTENAKPLAWAGAALLVEDSALSGRLLADLLEKLLRDPEERERMALRVRSFGNREAGKNMARGLLELASNVSPVTRRKSHR